ncbi:MAG TPA: hypothetical protein VEO95_02705 [Chthoniobacteraceae bacterium]|nr:hypothetical protein [Chthoniobacteraceae bacterium]
MNTEEHDDLWQLLGKAKVTKVSPFFSRNVLRAIREQQPEKSGLFAWLAVRWKIVAISACVLAMAGGVAIEQAGLPDPMVVLADQVSASPDYQVISHLDELLDSEHNSVWLEASAY